MDEWSAFVMARDNGALALWVLAVFMGLLVWVVPPRWRAWSILVLTAYAVGTAWML